MHDKTTLVLICSTIVKHETSEIRIQNGSSYYATLCENSKGQKQAQQTTHAITGLTDAVTVDVVRRFGVEVRGGKIV